MKKEPLSPKPEALGDLSMFECTCPPRRSWLTLVHLHLSLTVVVGSHKAVFAPLHLEKKPHTSSTRLYHGTHTPHHC